MRQYDRPTLLSRGSLQAPPACAGLCQATFHRRSSCLYTTLGFRTRKLLSCMNGPPLKRHLPGYQGAGGYAGRSRSLQRSVFRCARLRARERTEGGHPAEYRQLVVVERPVHVQHISGHPLDGLPQFAPTLEAVHVETHCVAGREIVLCGRPHIISWQVPLEWWAVHTRQ